jgi:AmiR/NasT family two-component response regulator
MRAKTSALEVILANGNGEDRNSLEDVLAGTPWVVVDADLPEIENVVREAAVPIVICDRDRSDCWRTMIRALIRARRDVCVIVLTDEDDADLSGEVVRCGGFDLLTRPFRRQQVLPLLVFAYTFSRGHGSFLRARRKTASRDLSLAGNA